MNPTQAVENIENFQFKPILGGNAGLVFLGILFFAVLIIGILILIRILKHKHKFRVWERTSSVPVLRDDKAMIYTDKSGVEKIHLLKMKKNAPMPPSDAYGFTNKGKYSWEAYYSHDKGFEYVFPTNKPYQISVEAMSTNQKQFMMEEYEKADMKKKKRLGEFIAQAAPYAALIIIVLSIFIFWNDITQPTVQMSQQAQKYQSTNLEILQILERMESEMQQTKPENVEEQQEVPN